MNQGGQTVKGVSIIATSQTVSSATYATLGTPDQVAGIVMPTNGLIQVWFQAAWQQSVVGAARAAIFVGTNQLQVVAQPSPVLAETSLAGAATNTNVPLASTQSFGLTSGNADNGAYTGDVTTGQILGTGAAGTAAGSGPCYIFAAAGSYTVSVQFKASSGSVTASNRKLWVQALSFA